MQADDTGGASFVDIPPNSGDNPAKMCAFRSTKILPQRPEWGGRKAAGRGLTRLAKGIDQSRVKLFLFHVQYQ